MSLQGKGFFTWRIPDCENGDANAIAALAHTGNLTHILLKIADGIYSYNIDTNGVDLVPPVVAALRSLGISPWGWHYIYGDNPLGEANKAIQRIQETGVVGYVIDVESEYKDPGKDAAAVLFMDRVRSVFPNLPIALSSYRYPSYHPQIPWEEFLSQVNYNMPQVYWIYNHNPAEQLIRSVSEFQAMTPYRPIIPTGSAYQAGGWAPTVADINEFLATAQSLNLGGANFWEWSNCRRYIPEIWDAISAYQWSVEPITDIAQQFIQALNTHDVSTVMGLYTPTAVHVTAARTVQGSDAIRTWYQSFFTNLLPQATFTLSSFTGTGSSRHLTWTAVASTGKVLNGNDTLGLVSGKIAYHYTFFTVS